MNDTQTIKPIVASTFDAANFGTGRAFSRVASADAKVYRRANSAIGSLSPTTLRIAHQPRKGTNTVQRTLCAVDQLLTRVDALGNPISTTSFKAALQADLPQDVSLAEFRAAVDLLVGFLTENDGANITALYAGEY